MPTSKRKQLDQLRAARSKATDYQTQKPPEEAPPSNQPRSLKAWRTLVEERIQTAMEEGRFDNLPGRGKPLNLNKNPHGDSSLDLAHGLLKNNGYTPEWVDRDLFIRRELETARERLRAAWQYYQPNPEERSGWHGAVERFAEALQKINRQIDDYNLVVPILAKQRFRLRLEDELRRVLEDSVDPN